MHLRIEDEVKSKFNFQILNGYTASCTATYTATYIIRNSQINNRRKIYALNAHSITFILIYLKMKKKKCGRSYVLISNELKLHVMTDLVYSERGTFILLQSDFTKINWKIQL